MTELDPSPWSDKSDTVLNIFRPTVNKGKAIPYLGICLVFASP